MMAPVRFKPMSGRIAVVATDGAVSIVHEFSLGQAKALIVAMRDAIAEALELDAPEADVPRAG